jgi:hypothetical protein
VRAPRAVDDVLTVLNGPAPRAEAVDVLANDRFAAGFTVTLAEAAHGAAVREGAGVVRYTPDRGFAGDDAVRYFLVEPDGRVAASAFVRVRVAAVDARDDAATTRVDTGVRVPVLANDVAPSGVTVVLATPGPSAGTVTVNADGSIDYAPARGATGTDRFRYSLTGVVRGTRVVLDTAVVRVTVTEVDVPPPGGGPGDPGTGDPGDSGDPGSGDPGDSTPPDSPPASTPGSTPEAPDDVRVRLDVQSVSPLAQVHVTGSGCPASKPVIVEVDGRVAARPTADADGEFSATVPAPDRVGRHHVGVTCGASTTTSDLDVVVTTMQSGTQAPAGAAAAAAALLLFFLLSGMGLNPTGRRAPAAGPGAGET